MVGTVGQTVTVYRYLIETGGPLVTILLGMGLGYYVGTRMDVRANYRRFLGVVGAGSTIGIVVAWAILIGSMSSFPSNVGSVDLLLLLPFVRMVVTVGLVVTIGAFAGAALAQFQANDRSPVRPMNSRTQPPSKKQEISPPDDLESHS